MVLKSINTPVSKRTPPQPYVASLLEQLPFEIRETIYGYLGYPVHSHIWIHSWFYPHSEIRVKIARFGIYEAEAPWPVKFWWHYVGNNDEDLNIDYFNFEHVLMHLNRAFRVDAMAVLYGRSIPLEIAFELTKPSLSYQLRNIALMKHGSILKSFHFRKMGLDTNSFKFLTRIVIPESVTEQSGGSNIPGNKFKAPILKHVLRIKEWHTPILKASSLVLLIADHCPHLVYLHLDVALSALRMAVLKNAESLDAVAFAFGEVKSKCMKLEILRIQGFNLSYIDGHFTVNGVAEPQKGRFTLRGLAELHPKDCSREEVVKWARGSLWS
ncbi:hypothetical protein K505DRAFT_332625 [Melanomma pulvis-pyrius CBS 109.77]|uniref:Uncharacterized protein n=1 Tax=Melanomma pulvis-pyrius CBS 109.77 TaxID=1314802 RepID=A0A6A6XSL2_9PLEO|nr:hypothetical protein K505DRAFT_332625 [Melanomma pulvis-pyrius CBS 109.77]